MQSFARSATCIALCAVSSLLVVGQVVPFTKTQGKPDAVAKGVYKFLGTTTSVEGICSVENKKVRAWKPDGSAYPALQQAIEAQIARAGQRTEDVFGDKKWDAGKKVRFVVLKLDRGQKVRARITIEGAGNKIGQGPNDWFNSIPGVRREIYTEYAVVRLSENPSAATSRVRLRAFDMPMNPLSIPCRIGAKGKLGNQTYIVDSIGRSDPGPKDLNPAGKLSVWYVKIKRTPGDPSAVNAGPGDDKGNTIQYADPAGNPAVFTPPPPSKHPGGLIYTSDLNYQVYNLPCCRTEVTHGTGSDSITTFTRVNPAVMPHLFINSSVTLFVDLIGIRLDPKK